jgi:hypothetical protein
MRREIDNRRDGEYLADEWPDTISGTEVAN